MNLAAVMDQLGAALKKIKTFPDEGGLQVFPFWATRVTPPAAVVGWPEEVSYDIAMVRGGDRIEIPVTVLVGRVDARTSRDVLAALADGTGPGSVKATIQAHDPGGVWDSARVTRAAEFSGVTVAGVEYLAAVFYIDIVGKGA